MALVAFYKIQRYVAGKCPLGRQTCGAASRPDWTGIPHACKCTYIDLLWHPEAGVDGCSRFAGLALAFFARLSIAPLWGTPVDQLGWNRGGPLAGLVLYLTGWWVLVTFVLGIVLVGRHWFNAVDGHPLLAPLIGAWMTWLMAGTGLLIDGADGLSGRTLLLVNLGGPVTVTMLSIVEILWLRHRGITFRSGPGGYRR
jgi:hypothetical protein